MVLALDPDNFLALHMLGVLKSQLGENEKGIEVLDKAVAINPSNAEASRNIRCNKATNKVSLFW